MKERERQRFFCFFFVPLSIHWLFLVRALTGDQTHNPGVPGRLSNPLSYLARTVLIEFLSHEKYYFCF